MSMRADVSADPATPADDDLMLATAVARREGWEDDLGNPPAAHGPRSLPEERAVARFVASSAPARRSRPAVSHDAKVRLGLLLLAVVVLRACWWMSPERTALGLVGAGLVCLIAMRRRARRRRSDRGSSPAHPLLGGFRPAR
jgi:hypothetical protein